jgi:hypothetical protein
MCLKIHIQIEIEQGAFIADELDLAAEIVPYYQVFAQENGFVGALSILDLLFNEGIDASFYLKSLKK